MHMRSLPSSRNPVTTRLGKVVYYRKKHKLLLKDAVRILRHVDLFSETPKDLLLAMVEIRISLFSIVERAFTLNIMKVSDVIGHAYWLLSVIEMLYQEAGRVATGLWENIRGIFKNLLG
jgi:hypothetical protein